MDTTPAPSPDTRPLTTSTSAPALAGFSVEPATLRRAASAYHAEADLLVEAASRLERNLATIGAAWGGDPVGDRFGATYAPAARQVTTNLGALSVGMFRIASALRAVADSYELVDDDRSSGATTRRMGGALPPSVRRNLHGTNGDETPAAVGRPGVTR